MEERLSFDEKLQSGTPRVLVPDYSRLGFCAKTFGATIDVE